MKWMAFIIVLLEALCLVAVTPNTFLLIAFSSDAHPVTTSLWSNIVSMLVLITPAIALIAVVLAALRFRYHSRWLSSCAFGLIPVWVVFMGVTLQLTFTIFH